MGLESSTSSSTSRPQSSGGLLSAAKDFASGLLGGVAQVLAGHPLDTVKVRLQTQTVVAGVAPEYRGMVDCFRKTVAEEGFRGLYKGAASPLTGAMFHNAALFFFYGQSQEIMKAIRKTESLQGADFFFAGGMTGVAAGLAESPIDLVKCKLQAQLKPKAGEKPLFTGSFSAAAFIAKNYGIRGLYQGLQATVIRNSPAFGSYFFCNEMMKRALTPAGERPSRGTLMLGGAAAGFGFWGVFYPLELIKTRMQTDHMEVAKRQYSGVLDCVKKSYAEGGINAFFRGYSPALLRAIVVNACIFLAVDVAKEYMNKEN